MVAIQRRLCLPETRLTYDHKGKKHETIRILARKQKSDSTVELHWHDFATWSTAAGAIDDNP